MDRGERIYIQYNNDNHIIGVNKEQKPTKCLPEIDLLYENTKLRCLT